MASIVLASSSNCICIRGRYSLCCRAKGGLEAERRARLEFHKTRRAEELLRFEALQQSRRESFRRRREALGLPPGDTDPAYDALPYDVAEWQV